MILIGNCVGIAGVVVGDDIGAAGDRDGAGSGDEMRHAAEEEKDTASATSRWGDCINNSVGDATNSPTGSSILHEQTTGDTVNAESDPEEIIGERSVVGPGAEVIGSSWIVDSEELLNPPMNFAVRKRIGS